MKNLATVSNKKSSVFLLVLALIVGGVGAQATGLLNTKSGGYVACVNSKTKIVTHPGKSKCPKGSKKLILGAQGAAGVNGLTGAAGLSGRDGIDGVNGKTLWNGTIDPLDQWGAAGDFYINYVTKTLFGPKSYNQSWPAGVSLVGPKGDQGPIGFTGLTGAQGPIGLTGATGPQGPGGGSGASGPAGPAGTNATIAITELFVCDGPDDGTAANEKCKIGMTGPGGGLIFFVDYNDQYAEFNYLEAAPKSCEAYRAWSSNTSVSIAGANGWAARAVGRGQANTTAIIDSVTAGTIADAPAAQYADTLQNGSVSGSTLSPGTCVTSKDDWFLASHGENRLMYVNLEGLGGLVEASYVWSSTEYDAGNAYFVSFFSGIHSLRLKTNADYVRPVRRF